jgi:hypothetical protein
MDAGAEAVVSAYFPDLKSRRGRQNRDYALKAIGVLSGNPAFDWLLSEKRMQFTLLSELGRIAVEEDMKAFASVLCEQKPPAKVAEARIRHWRLKQSNRKVRADSDDALKNALLKTLNRYIATHPETTKRQWRRAVQYVLTCVEHAEFDALPNSKERTP